MSPKLMIDKVQEGLCTKYLGRTILFSREVNSTNQWAKELAMHGAYEGTIVTAETQTEGRGRLGREWISPTGGLWFSVILRPNLRPAETVKLTFVAGLAVTKALSRMFNLKVETKWPNDVLVNKRKICGILTEMNTTGEAVNYVVVGIGVNVNFDGQEIFPLQLREVATSLENELGRKVKLEELFRTLLEQMDNLYELFTKREYARILDEWKKYAGFLGCQVQVTSPTEKINGLASDIDDDGSLVLKLEDGTIKHIFVGDVSLDAK